MWLKYCLNVSVLDLCNIAIQLLKIKMQHKKYITLYFNNI
jgi:hypothetical protein